MGFYLLFATPIDGRLKQQLNIDGKSTFPYREFRSASVNRTLLLARPHIIALFTEFH
jgi:hypothetical protein